VNIGIAIRPGRRIEKRGIFRGYNFTGGGGKFHIFLLIFAWVLQQWSATALSVISLLIDLTFIETKLYVTGVVVITSTLKNKDWA